MQFAKKGGRFHAYAWVGAAASVVSRKSKFEVEMETFLMKNQVMKTLPLIAVLDEHGYCRLLGSSKGEMYDVVVDKVKTTEKAVARDIFRQRGHDIPEPITPAGSQEKLTDEDVEVLWASLTDVPFDEDEANGDLLLGEDWHLFKKGTERETIWHWFDAQHSKGVAYLLYPSDFNSSEVG